MHLTLHEMIFDLKSLTALKLFIKSPESIILFTIEVWYQTMQQKWLRSSND